MDEMRFAMLLKKRGVRINREFNGISIAEMIGCISEETQTILISSQLDCQAMEKLFADSMESSGIKNIDREIRKRLNDKI
jgi:hypothetical protein